MSEYITARPDYVTSVHVPSKLVPSLMVHGPDILIGCPRCGHVSGAEISHGRTVTCQCGLSVTLWGNALELKEQDDH